jgi:O-methyltransferase
MLSAKLVKRYPIISEQIEKKELTVILNELEGVIGRGVKGAVCEFGCFMGTTSLFLQRILKQTKSKKKLYLYDSFEGLPEKTQKDISAAGEDFIAGELIATKSQLKLNFRKAHLRLPKIKKIWFSELKSRDLPKKISFALLDGDFYSSVYDSLHAIHNKLTVDGIVVVDDYDNPALPGAQKAVDEFLAAHEDLKLIQVTHSLAILQKI